MTTAERFIKKAQEVIPYQQELTDIDPSIDDASMIDQIMFRKGEYIGGMAAVILQLI